MKHERPHQFTGFPSSASEYREPQLELHTYLVRNPLSTFFARFEGDAMLEANIHSNDLLVIERQTQYTDGQIVLAFVGGERLLRILRKDKGKLLLYPANDCYRPIEIAEETQIFGRLLHSITHHLRVTKYLPQIK